MAENVRTLETDGPSLPSEDDGREPKQLNVLRDSLGHVAPRPLQKGRRGRGDVRRFDISLNLFRCLE